MNVHQQLIEICKEYILPAGENVVISEPYIPYIPDKWNRLLILAESQNLSFSNINYVETLSNMTIEGRIQRLGVSSDYVGVYPWDDGSIKLAVEASLKVQAIEVGVSNAVLWSQRGSNKENINPDLNLQVRSSEIWSKLLPILDPNVVVCCGKIALQVIKKSNWKGKVIHFRLPSKSAMSRVSGMFNETDLLNRYPEVSTVVDKHPHWLDGGYKLNKIFYACHAVSSQTKI